MRFTSTWINSMSKTCQEKQQMSELTLPRAQILGGKDLVQDYNHRPEIVRKTFQFDLIIEE